MSRAFKVFLAMVIILTMSVPSFMTTVPTTPEPTTPVKPIEVSTTFSDVPENHYALEAINTMSQLGIISGYPDGTFKPEAAVTRVEFAVMMVKALKLDVTKTANTDFEDLKKEKWAIPFVESAKAYLTGYKTTTGIAFKPNNPSVREDMAVALVKALKYPTDSEAILDQYTDANKVSKELKKYVAAAIDNNLMVGTQEAGKSLFYPQKSLTRAEAAQLLMNVIQEEKILFDAQDIQDNKVVFGEDKPVKQDQDKNDGSSTVKATVQPDGSVLLKWTKADANKFQGYKVVASVKEDSPSYPDNGYLQYITDINKTTFVIKPGMSYNNGDFSNFRAGGTYYFSITTLFANDKVPGNAVKVTLPKSTATVPGPVLNPFTLKAVAIDNGVKLQWTKAPEEGFQGYKVVASQKDGSPIYPDNGYFQFITDRSQTSITIETGAEYGNGDFTKFESGETYYFAITYLMDQGKKSSNVVKLTLK